VKLVRFRKSKSTYFLSYVEYRPNTNAAVLQKIGHAKGGHIWGKEGKKRWIWLMSFLYKNEYRILKPVEITRRRGLRLKGEK
jgi:hypothetical protein